LLLKSSITFRFTLLVCLALQVGISYLSVRSFLEGEWLMGFFFFLLVPAIGVLLVSYYLWLRRQGRGKFPKS
jgi:hypothetical protein